MRLNNDSMSMKQQKESFLNAVNNGQAIVIDNTNSKISQRSKWCELASEHLYKRIAIVFDVPKELCMKLNSIRSINPHRTHLSKTVPDIPIHSYFKNLEPPTLLEFDEIYTVSPKLTIENDEDSAFLNLIV